MKILIVEDEKDIRELLAKRLSKSGYEVLSAQDGAGAIEMCRAQRPDLVLLDIAMPDMDGYQICEKILSDPAAEKTKVLFLTGKELEPKSILERCETLGACGYLSKLATFDELLQKIKELTSA